MELKEQLIDPVRKFMAGSQKDIFDQAREFVRAQEPNFPYLTSDDTAQVTGTLNDPECFRGNHIQQLKTQVEALQDKVTAQV